LQSTPFTGTLYHGSNAVFEKFDRIKSRLQNDFYGGGVAYLVDTREIASQYAKNMSKGGRGSPVLYTVNVRFRKLFDTSLFYEGRDVQQLLPHDVEGFARNTGLFTSGANRQTVLENLKAGNIGLMGIDIFRGLSRGMAYTETARDHLQRLGFDGLKYLGGTVAGTIKHGVYLAYDPSSLTIVNGELLAFAKR
jgi:hypothetical protein